MNCVSRARAALDGNPKISLRICHLEECDREELVRQRFDTVVCVNVLEHIEDDIRALRLFRELVAPTNGRVLIFVPAVPAAYGPLDAALGHHRRYVKRTLRTAFDKAGLDLIDAAVHEPDRAGRLDVQRARQRRHRAHVGTGQTVRAARRAMGPAAGPAAAAADRALALRRRTRAYFAGLRVPSSSLQRTAAKIPADPLQYRPQRRVASWVLLKYRFPE